MRFLFLILFTLIPNLAFSDTSLPFYAEIMTIMGPLEYSGVPVLVKPQVSLSIDFANRQWIVHHMHEYDAQGGIVLEEGRYGLCAELATYMYERIKPHLNGGFEIKFAMASESGFFSAGQSNHIVLLLVDRSNKQIYLIDPSFHKYGRLKEMPEYQILNVQDSLVFVRDHSHDISFGVNQAIPLYIKNDFLLSFSVTSVDDKFDHDNFIFVISAMRRNKFANRDIVVIGRHNKEFEDFEDKRLLTQLLTESEIKTLFDKIKGWIQRI